MEQALSWTGVRISEPSSPVERDVSELVSAARGGELEAFGALVRRFQSRLLSYLTLRAPESAQAEDLAQAVFVAAFEQLGRFDPQRGEFGAWLFGIAANHVRRAWDAARRERRGLAALGERARAELAAEPEGSDEERLAALGQCVASLPEPSRRLVAAYYDEGLSLGEIAERRQTSASAIGVLLHRIRQRLRGCIERRLARESHR